MSKDEGNPLSEPLQEVPSALQNRRGKPVANPKRFRRNYKDEFIALHGSAVNAMRLLKRAKEAKAGEVRDILIDLALEALQQEMGK